MMVINNQRATDYRRAIAFLFIFVALTGVGVAHAEDFSSTNFTVQNPVMFSGGLSTSTSFGLQSIIAGFAPGTSTSSTFGGNAGFLFFPHVSTPAVSATAGDAQVALSWTSSSGTLGWSVSGYDVGQASVSGGPYTYSSVGNVLSSTRTGLTNGTTYYFVILPKDTSVDANRIATSSEVSATPVSSGGSSNNNSSSNSSSGGGGGGGGGESGSTVTISGRAYPLSPVTVLKDGQLAITTIAGPDAKFNVSLSALSAGPYTIAVYGEDGGGNRSTIFAFPVQVVQSATTEIGGVFLAPTIGVDKAQVKHGDTIAIFGQSVPGSDVTIQVNSAQELFATAATDAHGAYLYNLDTVPLDVGDHSTKSKSAIAGEISQFGKTVNFVVGTENIAAVRSTTVGKADINGDGKINLVDFSVLAYWYKRPSPPPRADLNGDGKVDLIDFSIMAFYWTG
ncbi:MAG TPA: dockerin type I repeat-containing protein [Candidatus Peribacteraceae bacterium]|nr:dockerin type I repeat-containing protein [Candidatus Peribacteraceae bacterium]